MECIILAAGYATRLYPLTKNVPKPLLPVAGRAILDRLLDKALAVEELEGITVVTNARFFDHFDRWRSGRPEASRISLVNDGSTANENRIGALRDLALAVESDQPTGPAIVLAGDNLFDFELTEFVDFFRTRETDCITTHRIEETARLQRTGVVEIDRAWRVKSFQEKPKEPRSHWAVPPFYLYRRETLVKDLPEFLAEGGDADAPGSLVPWLLARKPLHAFPFQGERYDIGNLESYTAARRAFGEDLE
ncbi:MAG: nucleotidyltransferase family protein [Alkalispirochaetaceae bacterium]